MQAVFPGGTKLQDGHYLAVNNRLNLESYCDSALASTDGQLGASLSRRRPGVVKQPLESQMQSLSPHVNPNPPQYQGPSRYSSRYFPSGEESEDGGVGIQDSGFASSSVDGKCEPKDRKRRQHRAH